MSYREILDPNGVIRTQYLQAIPSSTSIRQYSYPANTPEPFPSPSQAGFTACVISRDDPQNLVSGLRNISIPFNGSLNNNPTHTLPCLSAVIAGAPTIIWFDNANNSINTYNQITNTWNMGLIQCFNTVGGDFRFRAACITQRTRTLAPYTHVGLVVAGTITQATVQGGALTQIPAGCFFYNFTTGAITNVESSAGVDLTAVTALAGCPTQNYIARGNHYDDNTIANLRFIFAYAKSITGSVEYELGFMSSNNVSNTYSAFGPPPGALVNNRATGSVLNMAYDYSTGYLGLCGAFTNIDYDSVAQNMQCIVSYKLGTTNNRANASYRQIGISNRNGRNWLPIVGTGAAKVSTITSDNNANFYFAGNFQEPSQLAITTQQIFNNTNIGFATSPAVIYPIRTPVQVRSAGILESLVVFPTNTNGLNRRFIPIITSSTNPALSVNASTVVFDNPTRAIFTFGFNNAAGVTITVKTQVILDSITFGGEGINPVATLIPPPPIPPGGFGFGFVEPTFERRPYSFTLTLAISGQAPFATWTATGRPFSERVTQLFTTNALNGTNTVYTGASYPTLENGVTYTLRLTNPLVNSVFNAPTPGNGTLACSVNGIVPTLAQTYNGPGGLANPITFNLSSLNLNNPINTTNNLNIRLMQFSDALVPGSGFSGSPNINTFSQQLVHNSIPAQLVRQNFQISLGSIIHLGDANGPNRTTLPPGTFMGYFVVNLNGSNITLLFMDNAGNVLYTYRNPGTMNVSGTTFIDLPETVDISGLSRFVFTTGTNISFFGMSGATVSDGTTNLFLSITIFTATTFLPLQLSQNTLAAIPNVASNAFVNIDNLGYPIQIPSFTNARPTDPPLSITANNPNQIYKVAHSASGGTNFGVYHGRALSALFNYTASTVLNGVPAAGQMTWAEAVQVTSQSIRMNITTADAADISSIIADLRAGDVITIQATGNRLNDFQNWNVQATPVLTAPGFYTISCTIDTSGGTGTTNFANAIPLSIQFFSNRNAPRTASIQTRFDRAEHIISQDTSTNIGTIILAPLTPNSEAFLYTPSSNDNKLTFASPIINPDPVVNTGLISNEVTFNSNFSSVFLTESSTRPNTWQLVSSQGNIGFNRNN
jgi:hypothetical protein